MILPAQRYLIILAISVNLLLCSQNESTSNYIEVTGTVPLSDIITRSDIYGRTDILLPTPTDPVSGFVKKQEITQENIEVKVTGKNLNNDNSTNTIVNNSDNTFTLSVLEENDYEIYVSVLTTSGDYKIGDLVVPKKENGNYTSRIPIGKNGQKVELGSFEIPAIGTYITSANNPVNEVDTDSDGTNDYEDDDDDNDGIPDGEESETTGDIKVLTQSIINNNSTISENTIIPPNENAIVLPEDTELVISQGITLTLLPAASILFEKGSSISVLGTFIITGKKFGKGPSQNTMNNLTSENKGEEWGGINIKEEGKAEIIFAFMANSGTVLTVKEGGGLNLRQSVLNNQNDTSSPIVIDSTGSVSITNCTFGKSAGSTIELGDGGLFNISIKDSIFDSTASPVISSPDSDGGSAVSIEYNSFKPPIEEVFSGFLLTLNAFDNNFFEQNCSLDYQNKLALAEESACTDISSQGSNIGAYTGK